MGLGVVELIMGIEIAFGIAIPDTDAEKVRTVGGMYRYVLARLAEQGRLLDEGDPPSVEAIPSREARTRLARERRSRGGIGIWNRQAVWEELVEVIAEELNVKPERVTPDADFLDDLGA